jgi:hypothetical protein
MVDVILEETNEPSHERTNLRFKTETIDRDGNE